MHTCTLLLLSLQAKELAAALGGPVLLSKGQVDIISDGQWQLVVTQGGSPRRCGGQGDVLTGARIRWGLGQQQLLLLGKSRSSSCRAAHLWTPLCFRVANAACARR